MAFLGIDTSNYTTSAALLQNGEIAQQKMPLPVAHGEVGLRQSDAVFAHVKQLGAVLEQLLAGNTVPIEAVGVSVSPRDEQGSYMPCFLAGEMAARSVAATLGIPVFAFSHQAGHVAAALFSAERMDLFGRDFLAFHVSGGTTHGLLVQPDTGNKPFTITTLAQSLDLHAGQLIDRVGKLLGIDFPAGPGLELLAMQSGCEYRIKPTMKGADCCLSGVENQCEKRLKDGEAPADIAKFCLSSVGGAVLEMTRQLAQQYSGLALVYAGGVMANSQIRGQILQEFSASFAQPAFSADNAAGIAVLCQKAYIEGATV